MAYDPTKPVSATNQPPKPAQPAPGSAGVQNPNVSPPGPAGVQSPNATNPLAGSPRPGNPNDPARGVQNVDPRDHPDSPHGGQHHVKPNWEKGMGSVPVEKLTDADQKYLFKAYQHVGPDIYPAVLAGLRNDILVLLQASQNNTPEWTGFDPKGYNGPVKQAVDSYVEAHRGGRHFPWP